jgi:hypothetical protein
MPPAGSFFLDKKGTKKSRPIEICLSSLRNSGKKYFSAEFFRLLYSGKFQNGRLKNYNIYLCPLRSNR